MSEQTMSSAEQLEQMLHEGRVSEEEYETLRRAMGERDAQEAGRQQGAPRGDLKSSRRSRMVSGVCAGIANRFDRNIAPIRAVAVAALLTTGPLALVVYFLIAFSSPWDKAEEEEQASSGMLPGLMWSLGWLAIACANYIIAIFSVPHWAKMYSNLGIEIPTGGRLLITTSDILVNYSFFVVPLLMVLIVLLVWIYTMIYYRPLRLFYASLVTLVFLIPLGATICIIYSLSNFMQLA